MTELLTAAQMRAIEQAAIASGEVTGLELMERAGRGVVEAVFEEWPELAAGSYRAVVLCGPGNNGGDGFVVARLLLDWGWEVEVFLYGDAEKLPPDAKVNYERWEGKTSPMESIPEYRGLSPHLVVDAVFGTGLTRGLDKVVWQATSWAFRLEEARFVAVDMVSGIDSDSGKAIDAARHGPPRGAGLTVTFHRPKIGHFLAPDVGPSSERLCIKPIGLEKFGRAFDSGTTLETELTAEPVFLEKGAFQHSLHKYSYGHALILAGPPGHGGAARLAARGALRIGAGVVTLACLPDAIPENAARLDAIMLRPCPDADALSQILADRRISTLCLGPGMGVTEASKSLVASALAATRSTVLDADALTLLAADKTLFAQLHTQCVLTPHAGEFARLFPDISEKLNAPASEGPAYSKVDATREAAERAGCTVFFKGPDTVIADPSGRCAVNSAAYDRTAPWLATAGSGDVLAGFIAGLLARGFAALQAAETAAWLHVECARSFGPGLIAEDLPEELPKVFRDIGL